MIDAKKSPVMLHIPKTGGTSLRLSLGLPKWYKVHRRIGGKEMKRAVMRSDREAHMFTFYRDPLDRALSAFYFFTYSRTNDIKPPPQFTAVKQKAWLFATVARISGMDVNQFYKGLLEDDARQYKRMCEVIVHFKPYSYWIRKARTLKSKIHYYDFHNFAAEYDRLLDDIGAKARPKLYHRMRPHGDRDTWRELMTDETKDLLYKFYAEDYELLDKLGIKTESMT
jgi:hypothetical protein